MECENCTKKCPQMALADECAKGRMYATQELIKCQKELEQLKATIEEIRAKAIDEFAEKLKWEYENSIGIPQREINFAKAVIDQVAERLKGGNDHEQNYQGNT